MRKFLTIAQESFVGEPLGNENISMEEEALMIDESSQAAAEVEQDLTDAEHVIQVSEALEDLAVVAGSKEETTPHEAALIESAGQMAVAGTDVDPEEIVPAMESFKDAETGVISGKLAMEDFREKAKTLWENIQRILEEIWAKIESFFYKIFGTIPARRRTLKALQARVEESNKLTRDKAAFTVSGNRYMTTDNTVIKSADKYDSALSEFVGTAKWVYGGYVDTLKSDGDKIAKALESFNPELPAEATIKLAHDLTGSSANVPGSAGTSGARWPKYDVKKGHSLLGGVSLFSLNAKKSGGDEGALAVLDRARQAQVVLESSTEKANGASTSVEFQTFTQVQAEKAIKQMEELLDLMEEYQRGKAKGEIQATKKKIQTASAKAETASGKAKEKGEASDLAAIPHYRALVDFNVAYARWVQSPTIAFTKLAFGVINTTTSLINSSLSQYK